MAPLSLLAVFAGAGLGGILRYGMANGAGRWLGMDFPYGTLCVNVAGGFMMGLLVGFWVAGGTTPLVRLFWVTGVLGGFTTFSAFTLDGFTLLERQEYGMFAAYATASVAGALLALIMGLVAGRYFHG